MILIIKRCFIYEQTWIASWRIIWCTRNRITTIWGWYNLRIFCLIYIYEFYSYNLTENKNTLILILPDAAAKNSNPFKIVSNLNSALVNRYEYSVRSTLSIVMFFVTSTPKYETASSKFQENMGKEGN
jgi:hypothetical protein